MTQSSCAGYDLPMTIRTKGQYMTNDVRALRELDRNMDSVFDTLRILIEAMTAIVQTLPADRAAQASQLLDRSVDGLSQEPNPPGLLAQTILLDWRNQAATRAGLPARRGAI